MEVAPLSPSGHCRAYRDRRSFGATMPGISSANAGTRLVRAATRQFSLATPLDSDGKGLGAAFFGAVALHTAVTKLALQQRDINPVYQYPKTNRIRNGTVM